MLRDDLAVIVCYFNWCGYRRREQNFNRFHRQLAALGIPVYGAEASLTGEFITEGNPNWVHINATRRNICVQEEALLNVAETIVPEKYKKIAWIDNDIQFLSLNWYDEASIALDELNIIQLFEECYWTDSRGRPVLGTKAMLSLGELTEELVDTRKPIIPGYNAGPQTGFAYAAKRDLWKSGGKLYPYNFWTGGDRAQIFGVVSPDPTPASLRNSYLTNFPDFKPYVDWKKKFYNFAQGKTGYIEGTVCHEYHGELSNRGYGSGEKRNTEFGLDMKEHIFINDKGLLEFKTPPHGWSDSIEKYFKERREDDFELEPIKGINPKDYF